MPALTGSIDVSKVQRLSDLIELKPIKLSDADPAFREIIERLKSVDLNPPKIDPMEASNHPSKLYAEIVKDGKVIGKVYKSGCCETSNAVGAKLKGFFETTDDRDERASAIAKASGGTIRYLL